MRHTEEWRAVAGYEGDYEISSHGRLRSWKPRSAGRILKPVYRRGYPGYNLYSGTRSKKVTRNAHQLVLEAFVGPCPEGMVVRHLDGNCDNPTLSNLAYGTISQNIRDQFDHGTHHSLVRTMCNNGLHELTPENVFEAKGGRWCLECRRAQNARHMRRFRATKKLEPDDERHGTTTGYSSYGCRCEECRSAATKAARERRRARGGRAGARAAGLRGN